MSRKSRYFARDNFFSRLFLLATISWFKVVLYWKFFSSKFSPLWKQVSKFQKLLTEYINFLSLAIFSRFCVYEQIGNFHVFLPIPIFYRVLWLTRKAVPRTTKIPDGKLSNHGKISGGLLGIFAIKTKL